jgi:hypothetical protein
MWFVLHAIRKPLGVGPSARQGKKHSEADVFNRCVALSGRAESCCVVVEAHPLWIYRSG